MKLLFCILLIVTFSFICYHQSFGQEKLNIAAGVGFPELPNVGVRYQFEQTQIGVSTGFLQVKDERFFSVTGEGFLHFGKRRISKRRPWYKRVGLTYIRDETDNYIHKYLYLNVRIGRDLNISDRIGIQVDAGAGVELFYKQTRKDPKPPSTGYGFNLSGIPDGSIIPTLSIGVFYRI